MNKVRQLVGAGLLSIAIGAALSAPAFAQSAYADGPDWIGPRLESYHNYIAQMSPDNRAKLMAMEDKLMQMEMDRKSSTMKLDMEIAKARRDMQMFILSNTKLVGNEGH
jgi:hypothetical protein